MSSSAVRGVLSVLALCWATSACGGASERADTASRVSQPPEGRLPEGVRPTSYRLSLTIIPDQKTFSGTAVVGIELDEPSTTIWMHGEGLNVIAIDASHATTRIPATWEQRTLDGVARVEFQEALPAGKSTLHIEYTAAFNTALRGLYRVESGGDAYAFTQFESISARLAFPCFDEPRFKTP
ncbi:MAG: hypothetical protein OES21_07370, partial [Myxococcales bacterium]|nr:hypothetical protein [Myxococcales bacterium]